VVNPNFAGHYSAMSNDPFPLLETARLRLRCVALKDAAETSSLMTSEVSRWLASWPFPFTKTMAEKRIREMRAAALLANVLPYAIVLKEGQKLAGWAIIAKEVYDLRRGALSYWLAQPYQGRGFAREAITAVLSAGFEQLDLDVIEAGAQPDNVGSFAVMRACGMTETGVRMVYAPARGREELCLFHEISRST
jgi:[ribosomal protein S5]-alanine N-acetyltransferase